MMSLLVSSIICSNHTMVNFLEFGLLRLLLYMPSQINTSSYLFHSIIYFSGSISASLALFCRVCADVALNIEHFSFHMFVQMLARVCADVCRCLLGFVDMFARTLSIFIGFVQMFATTLSIFVSICCIFTQGLNGVPIWIFFTVAALLNFEFCLQ